MNKLFNLVQAKGKWHKFLSFNLGGGAKLYKNFAQKLLAASLCMAVVLLGTPVTAYIAEAAEVVLVTIDGLKYNLNDDYTAGIAGYTDDLPDDVVIPSEVSHQGSCYSVTVITDGAFQSSSLHSVSLPDTLTYVGKSAFSSCRSLTQVTIPASVQYVDSFAFEYCSALSHVSFDGDETAISGYAFKGCTSLVSVDLPSDLRFLYPNMFDGCSSLPSLHIPASVWQLCDFLFQGCSSLASVSLPARLTSIGRSSFNGCFALTTLTIPPNVTSVGSDFVANCTSLGTLFYKDGLNVSSCGAPDTTSRLAYTVNDTQDVDGKTAVTITSASKAATIACDAMGDNYVISGVAAGVPVTLTHDMPDALCTSACSFCGVIAGELDPTTHALSDVVISEPTAEKLGAVHSMCSRCDYDVFSHYTLGDGASPTMYPDGTRISDASYTPKAGGPFNLNGQEIEILLQDPLGVLGSGELDLEVHPIDLPGDFDDDVDVEHAHAYEIVPTVDGVKVSGGLSNKVRLLYKIPQGWDRADLEVFLAQAGEDREFDEVTEKIGDDEYLVVWTDHFSPYVFVDKLNPEEKAALETLQDTDGSNGGANAPQNGAIITTDSPQSDSGNGQTNGDHSIKTGDASGEILMLSTLAMIATGLYLELFLKKSF